MAIPQLLPPSFAGGNYGASLWSTNSETSVIKIADLPGHTGPIRRYALPLQPISTVQHDTGTLSLVLHRGVNG